MISTDLLLISEMVDKLLSTTKRLEKEAILREYEIRPICKKVLHFLCDPFTISGLSDKKITKRVKDAQAAETPLTAKNTLTDVLEYFAKHNTGRDKDIVAAQKIIELSSTHAPLLTQILCKNLKLGVDAKTLNKVYGNDFINIFSVMLAMNWQEEEESVGGRQIIITQKLDGHRCVAFHYETGAVKFYTRQGQDYGNIPDVEAEIKKFPKGFVYDGELLTQAEAVADIQFDLLGQPILSGSTFGQTSSMARKKDTKTQLCLHLFDMLPVTEFIAGSSEKNALERKQQLHAAFTAAGKVKWLKEVEALYIGEDTTEVARMHEKAKIEGWEGVMVNIAEAPYQCKRTKDLLKAKQFHTADVRVKSIFEGNGKYKGMLGGVTVEFEHENKTWLVDCGSGFTEEERTKYWSQHPAKNAEHKEDSGTSENGSPSAENLVGRIIEVQYFEISQDKDGNFSLRFPVFLKVRDDKDEISMH